MLKLFSKKLLISLSLTGAFFMAANLSLAANQNSSKKEASKTTENLVIQPQTYSAGSKLQYKIELLPSFNESKYVHPNCKIYIADINAKFRETSSNNKDDETKKIRNEIKKYLDRNIKAIEQLAEEGKFKKQYLQENICYLYNVENFLNKNENLEFIDSSDDSDTEILDEINQIDSNNTESNNDDSNDSSDDKKEGDKTSTNDANTSDKK